MIADDNPLVELAKEEYVDGELSEEELENLVSEILTQDEGWCGKHSWALFGGRTPCELCSDGGIEHLTWNPNE